MDICDFSITSYAQKPTFTANDVVEPYSGIFAYGTNPGYYSGFNNNAPTDKLLSDLMEKAGLYSMRPKLNDKFVEDYGINVRLNEFKYYVENKKMHDITLFLDGDILASHQSTETITCSSKTLNSKVFKNMYLPIWDTSDPNKTPINENNYYAYFVYKVIQTYGDYIKFVEVWNEPDFTYSGLGDKNKGEAGNWFDNEPNPCDLPNLNASIPQYVRLLRITYEVVKALKPSLYVTTGGIGYASFLDAMMRVTDNPDGGKVSAEYPLKGGAYFDVLSYHSYPQYNQRVWNSKKVILITSDILIMLFRLCWIKEPNWIMFLINSDITELLFLRKSGLSQRLIFQERPTQMPRGLVLQRHNEISSLRLL